MRCKTRQERLCRLTLLSVHHEIRISINNKVKRLVLIKKKKGKQINIIITQASTSFFLHFIKYNEIISFDWLYISLHLNYYTYKKNKSIYM